MPDDLLDSTAVSRSDVCKIAHLLKQITPEMVEAGVRQWEIFSQSWDAEYVVSQVYKAMFDVRFDQLSSPSLNSDLSYEDRSNYEDQKAT